MSASSDPASLVPQGSILIGANIDGRTGDVDHTLLMHEDVEPSLLHELLRDADSLPVKRRKFRKLRLPPKGRERRARSFRKRMIVRRGRIITNMRADDARRLLQLVLADMITKMGVPMGGL